MLGGTPGFLIVGEDLQLPHWPVKMLPFQVGLHLRHVTSCDIYLAPLLYWLEDLPTFLG